MIIGNPLRHYAVSASRILAGFYIKNFEDVSAGTEVVLRALKKDELEKLPRLERRIIAYRIAEAEKRILEGAGSVVVYRNYFDEYGDPMGKRKRGREYLKKFIEENLK